MNAVFLFIESQHFSNAKLVQSLENMSAWYLSSHGNEQCELRLTWLLVTLITHLGCVYNQSM
jgi:hypothetical protein